MIKIIIIEAGLAIACYIIGVCVGVALERRKRRK